MTFIPKELVNTKSCIKDINKIIEKVKELKNSRETSLTITKLQEAAMWLEVNYKTLESLNS